MLLISLYAFKRHQSMGE